MNKILKYCLIGAGGLVGLAVLGAAYLAATFNPNDYKEKIVSAVRDSTHRTLRLDGDIKLSFFPNIGAEVGKVSLSEVKSDKEFAAVERARVSLALMPLLKKQVVVDKVAVSGLHATLVKRQDGSINIGDLLGEKKEADHKAPAKPESTGSESKGGEGHPLKFDISAVAMEKTNLTYRDEATGAEYAIKELSLDTGRIANTIPSQITLSAVIQANQPKLELAPQLKTTLTFDLDKNSYRLENMELQVSGTALDISDLKLHLSGDVDADLTGKEFSAANFALKAMGVKDKEKFEATLEAPALSLAKDKFSGDKLVLNAKQEGASGTITAALSLPGLQGNAQSFKCSAFVLDVDLNQPEQKFKVKLTSPLTGNLEARQFEMTPLALNVDASGDSLPNKSIKSEMKGSLRMDLAKQSVQLDLAGGLLQSQVKKAKVEVLGFANPAIQFDVDVDQFDADLYLPKKATPTAAPTGATAPASAPATATVAKATKADEKPLDLSGLRKLNLDGSLRLGALKVANVKSTRVLLAVKAHDGLLDVRPLSANLYGGSMDGGVSVDARNTPTIAIKEKLTGIDVAPLTKDAAHFDTLQGKGDVNVDLTLRGNTVSEMKKAMNGTMALSLVDGAIKGFNIAKHLREAENLLGGSGAKEQTQVANNEEKTDFSELKATFKVTKGVAHNDDLALKSPLLRLTGAGDIDIGNDKMNYTATATLAKTLQGQGGKDKVAGIPVPVRIKGPLNALKYTLDLEALFKEEVKSKLQDQIKSRLPGGLFK